MRHDVAVKVCISHTDASMEALDFTVHSFVQFSQVEDIADKLDVHRSCVKKESISLDVHDRVNYSVTDAKLDINSKKQYYSKITDGYRGLLGDGVL